MKKLILPGSAVGVLGSGQLGRMFALAARRMGYRIHTFSPETNTPTGQAADVEIQASYDDVDALKSFAENVDVITFEFENVPAAAVNALEKVVPIRPGGAVLHTTQNRLREKNFLSKNGFPVAAYRAVDSLDDLKTALKSLGTPAVLKTAGFGYDGKGQRKINSMDEAEEALKSLGGKEAVLESFVDFEMEISVVAARALNGAFAHYGVIENSHKNHILDVSVSPLSALTPGQAGQAVEIARAVLEALDVVGVLCVEFFVTKSGKLLINELAPRPHNSGHITVDACVTSQFEQQLRAVCGLPLGSTDYFCPAAMANLLGDIWEKGEPRWARALALPDVKLHIYGKSEPRPGRKMGHVTALASAAETAKKRVIEARRALQAS